MYTNGLRLRDIEKKAALFDLPLNQAIGARRAFLQKEMDYYMNCECDYMTWRVICLPCITDILKELLQFHKDLYYWKQPKRDDEINENMISRAKEYPLTDLYKFVKGKACCPVHKEKTASLNYNPQRNKAHCFGCGVNMDSIDMYMLLNEVAFPVAVRFLCQA